MDVSSNVRATMKYDCFHHVYEPKMRFYDIKRKAEKGSVLFTRQAGILYALGLGCEKNPEISERLFKRCILWGDRVSALYLNWLHLSLYSPKYEDGLFEKIYRITDGVLNSFEDNVSKNKGKEWEYYGLIRSVEQNVILKRKETSINICLADTLSSDFLSFQEKEKIILSTEKLEQRKEVFSKNPIGFCRW